MIVLRVATALTCLFLVTCDTSFANDQLGVLKDERDRIHILYVGCEDRDERVLSAEIARVQGKLGGGDDTIVWRVEALDDVSKVDLVVGEQSAAFEETIPLMEQLRGTYTVVVSTSADSTIPQGVNVDSLTQGMVDTGTGGVMTKGAFQDVAEESCQ
jgi:hypothetical protein